MGPEDKIERYLRNQVKKRGGKCIKIIPTVAGWPDRLVVAPGGAIYLVELKSATGRLRPAQVVVHERLARIGCIVVVIKSKDEVDAWLRDVFE